MPELPEVETIRRDLNGSLPGKEVLGVRVDKEKLVGGDSPKFAETLVGRKFTAVSRRGKLLIFEFDKPDLFLLIHLKMTGQLILDDGTVLLAGGHSLANKIDNTTVPNKYTHVILSLTDHANLYYNDLRQFGYLEIVGPARLAELKSKFGPEPLTKDFDYRYWQDLLSRHSKLSIKQLLLKQEAIAGIGNIYADEICYMAKVRPDRLVGSLSKSEAAAIFDVIPKILKLAIQNRGTTFNDYRDARGKKGNYVKLLKVYGRKGEPCRICSNKIEKIKHHGRGTHFCSNCQT